MRFPFLEPVEVHLVLAFQDARKFCPKGSVLRPRAVLLGALLFPKADQDPVLRSGSQPISGRLKGVGGWVRSSEAKGQAAQEVPGDSRRLLRGQMEDKVGIRGGEKLAAEPGSLGLVIWRSAIPIPQRKGAP